MLMYHVQSIDMERDRNGTDTPGASQRFLLESELHRLWSSKPWYHPPVWANSGRYPALSVSHMRQHLCRNHRHSLLWSASHPGNDLGMPGLAAERNSLAAIHRVKGIKEETVMDWLRLAADHVERIEALLLANFQLTRAQLDAMWTYVGHKGEKGGARRRTSVAHSGAASLSRATRACE